MTVIDEKCQHTHRRQHEGGQRTHGVIDDANNEGTARTFRDIVTVSKVELGDLEAVAARAGEVEDLLEGVPCEVLDLDLEVRRFKSARRGRRKEAGGGVNGPRRSRTPWRAREGGVERERGAERSMRALSEHSLYCGRVTVDDE